MVVKSHKEQHLYKIINNYPTHLITWGNPFECGGQDVIVCITGNPGIADFYIEFGEELHNLTSLPVCVIGHIGHDDTPEQESNKTSNQDEACNLKSQVEHKLELIKNHIDRNSKIHLIGHSIGAWMTIELMDENNFLQDKVISTNLLFPTVQKMAKSKNGIFLNSIIRRIHPILVILPYLLMVLPKFVMNFFIECYIKFNKLPASYSERIPKFLKPKCIENVLLLAYNEMDTVRELNEAGVKKLSPNTNIIYSTKDNWAPIHYVEELKALKPSFVMNKVDISHAFVTKASEKVALMVSEYLTPKIQSK